MNSYKLLLCMIAISAVQTRARVGCMDTSKHVKIKDGYDYKTLHYVACSCPCNKERHLMRKGKCFKCRHYVKLDIHAYDMNFLHQSPTDSIFGTVMPFTYF